MRVSGLRTVIPIVALLVPLSSGNVHARELTFEERVKAQEAIERVYYTHQIGTTGPFEEAVPHDVLEKKVRTYLKQSVALERFWKSPVTAATLQRELERIAASTRLPQRLEEVYGALGHDPFLILECFARPVLVERLTRSFFAFDQRIHATARKAAEDLRQSLLRGELSAFAGHPGRTVVEAGRVGGKMIGSETGRRQNPDGPRRIDLDPDEYRRWRALGARLVGEIGPVAEDPEAYLIRVILAEEQDGGRSAVYAIRKISWDDWWSSSEDLFDHRLAEEVAGGSEELPLPGHLEAATSSCEPEDSWQNGILDDVPDGRSEHTAIWTGSVMVVWGGWKSIALNTGGRYDPLTDTWTLTSTAGAPSARYSHSAVWTGSVMIVWGGQDYSQYLGTGGRYDPVSDTWTPTSMTGAPSIRDRHTAVWTGSLMVVWGGSGLTISHYLNTGGRYDPVGDTWMPTSITGAPSIRDTHTAVWTGSHMVVWGGADGSGYLGTGGRYDPVSDAWTPTSMTGAPSARYSHSAVWTGSHMVVWGGYNAGYLDTGGRYDPVSDAWISTSMTGAPSARYSHSVVWTGSHMVVWGGYNAGYLGTGGRYDPVNDTWTPISTTGAPSSRSGHTAIWTGSLMIVWGGTSNTGGRYDPVGDTWTPTSIGAAPAGRWFHTAVWTGSLMIAWGGGDGFGYFDTGGRYDPVSDAWTPTSTVNAPARRSGYTAIWAGGRMIVWGGYNAGNLDTGGRYDPVSDTWTPTSTTGAPAGRYDHTAVWTGTRMVVWGGYNGGGILTGGRYDPVSDTWRPVSAVNAPEVRVRHAAVWTGSVMIVWGGSGSGPSLTYSPPGGRYDPVKDVWLPMSTAGEPQGRDDPAPVWTGSLMVVWGGSQYDDIFFDSGGRYDPVSDRWTPMATFGAPYMRDGHTAVWTGSLVVVWGGRAASSPLGSGGRYDPQTDMWAPTSLAGAPSARSHHTAVWTGRHMIVWGGYPPYLNSGGQYAVGGPLDYDGDGFRGCDGDCNDSFPSIHPGAVEVCDGIDNDCDGIVDGPPAKPHEVTGLTMAPDGATLSWDVTGASYDLLRGALADFPVGNRPSETCLASEIATTTSTDASAPAVGGGFWYLVRAVNACGTGTYGAASGGAERLSTTCP